jgi:hypothetical protein
MAFGISHDASASLGKVAASVVVAEGHHVVNDALSIANQVIQERPLREAISVKELEVATGALLRMTSRPKRRL